MPNPHKLGFRIAGLIEATAEGLGIIALMAILLGYVLGRLLSWW